MRVVLVRTAETPSLVWEISEIVFIASPDRVVLWHSGGKTEWDRFRSLVDEKLPHPLPQDFREPGLLRFEAGWIPRWLTISEVGQQQHCIAKELGRLAARNRAAPAGDKTAGSAINTGKAKGGQKAKRVSQQIDKIQADSTATTLPVTIC